MGDESGIDASNDGKSDSNRVHIFDTTLRDGEQVPGAQLNLHEKLEVAQHLARLKVDVIEAGFPFSSPGDFEAVSRIASEVRGPQICGLARAVERDIKTCADAIKHAETPRLHTFIGTSDINVQSQLRKTRDEVLKIAVGAVELAHSLIDVVEFSPMDATRTDPGYLCEVVAATIEAGATIINIPDTVGYAVPEEFGALIRLLFEKVPNINDAIISVHCHDDLGMATINSITAVHNGARQIECTVNGVGERAGMHTMPPPPPPTPPCRSTRWLRARSPRSGTSVARSTRKGARAGSASPACANSRSGSRWRSLP